MNASSDTLDARIQRATNEDARLRAEIKRTHAHLLSLQAERSLFDDGLLEIVKSARSADWRWEDIGNAFGVTKQSAHLRWAHRI